MPNTGTNVTGNTEKSLVTPVSWRTPHLRPGALPATGKLQESVAAGVSHKQHPDHIAQQLNISKDEARAWDQSARLKLAEELGHGRTDITNNYLG